MSLLINKILEAFLKISGMWPYDSHFMGPIILSTSLITLLPFQFWKAIKVMNDPLLFMDILSDILAEVLILIKLFAMWGRRRDIQNLLREMGYDWNKTTISDEWRVLARYCYIFCRFDVALYASAISFYYPDMFLSYVNKPEESRQLMFRSYYPFNYQKSPTYEILNVLQIIQGLSITAVDSLSKSLLVAYVLHASARIHTLKSHIEEYSKNCRETSVILGNGISEELKVIIREHQSILIIVKKIENSYSLVTLFQILFSSMIICVTGFVMVTAMESANAMLMLKFVAYIIAMLFQVFTFCIAGQYLYEQGESIIDMICNCAWYNRKPEEIKAMAFIIGNAQHNPLKLRGGKFVELSINTFAQIIKSSYSYLSVLRTAYD